MDGHNTMTIAHWPLASGAKNLTSTFREDFKNISEKLHLVSIATRVFGGIDFCEQFADEKQEICE